jgi:hypothetical protein
MLQDIQAASYSEPEQDAEIEKSLRATYVKHHDVGSPVVKISPPLSKMTREDPLKYYGGPWRIALEFVQA